MSGTTTTAPAGKPVRNTRAGTWRRLSARRVRALARAELTLLVRNRSALFIALLLPTVMALSLKSTADQADLSGTGLSVGTTVLPGAVGMVLLFAVYSNLVGVYVGRREELVLKRLRTGEADDLEILSGPRRCRPSPSESASRCCCWRAGPCCWTWGHRPGRTCWWPGCCSACC